MPSVVINIHETFTQLEKNIISNKTDITSTKLRRMKPNYFTTDSILMVEFSIIVM